MRTPRPLPEGAAERFDGHAAGSEKQGGLQRIQCVWLRAALGLHAAQIAIALGWQVSSVRQVHSDYLRHGETVLRGKAVGGRHRQNAPSGQGLPVRVMFQDEARFRRISDTRRCWAPAGVQPLRTEGEQCGYADAVKMRNSGNKQNGRSIEGFRIHRRGWQNNAGRVLRKG